MSNHSAEVLEKRSVPRAATGSLRARPRSAARSSSSFPPAVCTNVWRLSQSTAAAIE